jgi:hypothetical protein
MQDMETNEARAKLIAKQETSTSLKVGKFDMAVAAGLTYKTWHHVAQDHPRVEHEKLDNRRIPIHDKFGETGLLCPNDPNGSGKEVINCNCFVTFDKKGDNNG